MKSFRFPFIFRLYDEAFSSKYYSLRQKMELYRVLFALWYKNKFFDKSIEQSKDKIATQKMFGFKVSGYSYRNLLYLFREIFVSNDYYFETDKSRPKVVDCGANIGMASIYFKMLYPNCEILAFEPNPHAFQMLKKNIEDNQLKGVQLFNLGLSDEEGEIDFYLDGDKGSLLGSFESERGGGQSFKVMTKELSKILDAKESYDLVKMDVEGAEWQIVKDLLDHELIKCAKEYIVEYHHLMGEQSKHSHEFISMFEKNDYRCNVKADFDKKREFQDMLIYGFLEDVQKDLNSIDSDSFQEG